MTRERYESLPLATLKELAKARNMKGVSTLKKSALIDEMLKLDETEKQMQANEKAKEEVRQEMKEKKEESDIEQLDSGKTAKGWGAVYAQYLESMDQIGEQGNGLSNWNLSMH